MLVFIMYMCFVSFLSCMYDLNVSAGYTDLKYMSTLYYSIIKTLSTENLLFKFQHLHYQIVQHYNFKSNSFYKFSKEYRSH